MHVLLKHPPVDRDVEEAAFWYDERDPGVAIRFADATRAAMFAAMKNSCIFYPL